MNDARTLISELHLLTLPAGYYDHAAIEAACKAYLSLRQSQRAPTSDSLVPITLCLDEPLPSYDANGVALEEEP